MTVVIAATASRRVGNSANASNRVPSGSRHDRIADSSNAVRNALRRNNPAQPFGRIALWNEQVLAAPTRLKNAADAVGAIAIIAPPHRARVAVVGTGTVMTAAPPPGRIAADVTEIVQIAQTVIA